MLATRKTLANFETWQSAPKAANALQIGRCPQCLIHALAVSDLILSDQRLCRAGRCTRGSNGMPAGVGLGQTGEWRPSQLGNGM